MKEIKGEIKDKCYICGRTAESFIGDFNISEIDFRAEQNKAVKAVKAEKDKLIKDFKDKVNALLKKIENLPEDIDVENTPSLAEITDYTTIDEVSPNDGRYHARSDNNKGGKTVASARAKLKMVLGMLDDEQATAKIFDKVKSWKSSAFISPRPEKGTRALFIKLAELEDRKIFKRSRDIGIRCRNPMSFISRDIIHIQMSFISRDIGIRCHSRRARRFAVLCLQKSVFTCKRRRVQRDTPA